MDFARLHKISWFPGHMLKAERQLRDKLTAVDLVVELLDARAPESTRNGRLANLVAHKPQVMVLGKSDLADPGATREWQGYFRQAGAPAFTVHHRQFKQLPRLLDLMRDTARKDPRCKWGSLRYRRPLRVVVVGLPNVGKSTLINALVGRRRAKIGPKPGVTRHQQWVLLGDDVELLDTPGIMVPRVDSVQVGLKLALLAIVRPEIVSAELVAEYLHYELQRLHRRDALAGYDLPDLPDSPAVMLEELARRLGLMQSGGQFDTVEAASHLLRDFRDGKLGRLTFERPDFEEI